MAFKSVRLDHPDGYLVQPELGFGYLFIREGELPVFVKDRLSALELYWSGSEDSTSWTIYKCQLFKRSK